MLQLSSCKSKSRILSKPSFYKNIYHFSLSAQRALKRNLGPGLTKAGLDMVTKQFALELGPHKIRVNSASLTLVLTEKNIKLLEKTPEWTERFTAVTPQGKICDVNNVISPILYLLSDASSMVTGTLHTVDGGLLCHIPV